MQLRTACIFLLLLPGSVSPGCKGNQPAETVVRWDASAWVMPDQTGQWLYWPVSPGDDPVLQQGFLRINTLVYRDITDRCWYGRNFRLHMPRRFVVEARLRVVDELRDPFSMDHAAVISAAVAPHQECFLFVGPDGLRLNNDAIPLPDGLNVTDEFHNYRMEVEDGLTTLFIDGTEIARARCNYNPGATTPSVSWGDMTRLASGISDWVYVWHNAGE